MKNLEKFLLILCVLAFIAAAASTISAESHHQSSPVEFTKITPVETTETPQGAININTADSETLQTLPGIGPTLADRIIEFRETYGSFRDPSDIIDVHGIGIASFEKIKDKICV